MKNFIAIIFVVIAVVVALAHSIPIIPEEQSLDLFALEPDYYSYPVKEERADRHRRVTCDLLSISTPWGSVNHAACAANCLSLRRGYRGGRCRDGVCHCRR